MKTISNFYCAFLLLGFAPLCQAQQATQQTVNLPAPTSPVIISRAANARVWERIEYQSGPNGQAIPIKHHFTEISDGVCYQDPNSGQWTDSQEQITIQPDGSAAAVNGRHHASFPANIYEGAITLTTPEGLQLISQPVGLSFEDGGTNIVLFATLTNAVGELISSNQIIYRNAFAGVDADLLYNYTKNGLEQDLVFRQQPPAPEQFGLNSANTRLQLLTEFFDPPTPSQAIGPVNPQDGLRDTTLSFGSMTMTHGRAFLTSASSSQHDLQSVSVYKSWIVVDGRTLLVEEVPYQGLTPDLASLPPPSAANPQKFNLRKASPKRLLPPVRLAQVSTNRVHLAIIDRIPKPGVTFDYTVVNSGETNFCFRGDGVFYVSAKCLLAGTTVIEGSSILKFGTNCGLEIAENGALECQTAPFRPAVLTSVNDDSIGEPIWGISSGTPNFNDDTYPFITIDGTNANFHDLRFSYGWQAVAQGSSPANVFTVRNCQFYDLLAPVYANQIYLYNDLIGFSTNEEYGSSGILAQGAPEIFIEYTGGGLVAENVTSDSGYGFTYADGPGQVIALTNCLITSQMLTNGSSWATLLTNSTVVYLPTPTTPVYQVVGGGNYYLTNGSPYRGHGTANIDPDLYVDLAAKTTYPPVVYSGTNISSLGTLGQCVARDTNTFPDIGYHFDPLDYAFGGCDLYSNLTITAGTAVAWFETNGAVNIQGSDQPYGITLNNGANLSFNGNATQPCIFARSDLVQEGGNWGNTGWNLGLVFMGSSREATVSANFTKWTSSYFENILQDRSSEGQGFFRNCEFYNNFITTWNVQYLYYTNCLLFRPGIYLVSSPNFALENCTVYNGGITMDRSSAVDCLIQNSSFDGTGFNGSDSHSSNTNYTTIGYNAYNTNNLSWQTYPLNPPYNGKLEISGSSDVLVTNYDWQSSWFGTFYLPPYSTLINAGSTTADQLGLYHFTTQTNQIPETNSTVDIGYHYVATDQFGNPLDSNGDGIPDYLEDPAGNGFGNWDTTLFLNVIITQPRNGSALP